MKRVSPHWYWIPTIGLLAFIIMAIGQVMSASAHNEREALLRSNYPTLSIKEFQTAQEAFIRRVKGPQAKTADEYFEVLAESQRLEAAAYRLQVSGVSRTQGAEGIMTSWQTNEWVNKNHDLMSNLTREEVDASHKRTRVDYYQLGKGSKSELWPLVLLYGYIALIVAPIFFMIRLKRKGLRVGVELPYILKWSVLWPYGLFKYPVGINPLEQVKRFYRFVSAAVAGLLALAPVSMASAKSGGGSLGGSETVQVDEPQKAVSTKEGPPSQVLPTLVVENVTFNLNGWVHVTDTPANDNGPKVAMAKARVVVGYENFELFSQFDVNGTPTVDVLSLGYRFDDYAVRVGRNFSVAINSVSAPFLQETVTDPPIPVAFFQEGVSFEGREGAVSFGADLAFDGTTGGAYMKYDLPSGAFARLSVQHNDDTRLVLDGEVKSGPHTIRAAAFYRTRGDRAGAYLLYVRDIDALQKGAQLFTQVAVDGNTVRLLGGIGIPINDNISLTLQAGEQEAIARARWRF